MADMDSIRAALGEFEDVLIEVEALAGVLVELRGEAEGPHEWVYVHRAEVVKLRVAYERALSALWGARC